MEEIASSDWKEDLLIAVEKLQKEKLNTHGNLGKFLDNNVAKKHGLSLSTVKTAYYKFLKEQDKASKSPTVKDETSKESEKVQTKEKDETTMVYANNIQLDQIPQEYSPEEQLMIRSIKHARSETTKPNTIPPYRYGDLVEIKVTAVVPYGAFVVTLDEYSYSGLIHITEVRDGYIYSVEDYLRVGDVLTAKVKKLDPQGKLALTIKDMPLPSQRVEVEELKEETPEQEISKIGEIPTTIQLYEEDQELAQIITYMNEITGIVSPQAKEALKEMIAKYGLFKFTMALGKVAPTFEADLGKMLIKEVEKKIGDRL